MKSEIAWSQGIEDAWSKVATGVPKVIAFLAVLLIGLFVVRIITRIVGKLLAKVNVDGVLDRAGLAKYINRAGLTGKDLLTRAVSFFLKFVVVTTAFAVFGPNNPVSRLIDRFVLILPRLVIAAAIVVITGLVARFAQTTMYRLSRSAEGVEGVRVPAMAIKAAPIAIWVIGGFAAVDQLGIAPNVVQRLFTAALAMVVGIGIVAIGGGGIKAMQQRWDGWLGQWDKAKQVDAPEGFAPPFAAPAGAPAVMNMAEPDRN